MVGIQQTSKTQLDLYRRQFQKLQQQHPSRRSTASTTVHSEQDPTMFSPLRTSEIMASSLPAPTSSQPSWRTGLLSRLVRNFRVPISGGSTAAGPPVAPNEDLDRELAKSMGEVIVTAGERFLGLPAAELQTSPGLNQMVHRRVASLSATPDWMKLTGSLVCKRIAQWIQPPPATLSMFLPTRASSDPDATEVTPLLERSTSVPPPIKKRRVTKAIQNPETSTAPIKDEEAFDPIVISSGSDSSSSPTTPKKKVSTKEPKVLNKDTAIKKPNGKSKKTVCIMAPPPPLIATDVNVPPKSKARRPATPGVRRRSKTKETEEVKEVKREPEEGSDSVQVSLSSPVDVVPDELSSDPIVSTADVVVSSTNDITP